MSTNYTPIIDKSITELFAFFRDIGNILFFVVAIILTILTYINARKTLLQPIKTEIIKRQLDIYIELNSFIDSHYNYSGGELALINIIFYFNILVPKIKKILNPTYNELLSTISGSLPIPNEDVIDSTIATMDGIRFSSFIQKHTNGTIAIIMLQLDKEYYVISKLIEKYNKNPFLSTEIIENLYNLKSEIVNDLKKKMGPVIEEIINNNLSEVKNINDINTLNTFIAALSVKAHNNFNKSRSNYQKHFNEIKSIIRNILKMKKYV